MSTTVKFVAKRKLAGIPDMDIIYEHFRESFGTAASVRVITANDNQAVLTLIQNGSAANFLGGNLLLEAKLPLLRFAETDQTDPVGRYGFMVNSGRFQLLRFTSADWANTATILNIDPANKLVRLANVVDDGSIFIYAGKNTGAFMELRGDDYAGTPGTIRFRTPVSGFGSYTERLVIGGGANYVHIDVKNSYFSSRWFRGDGTNDLLIEANRVITDATEKKMQLNVLDAGNNTFLNMITLTPNGTSPTMDFNSRPISNLKLGGTMDANSNAITNHTQSIADNVILTVDHASVADNDYAKFTANGLEGREYSEVLSDLLTLGDLVELQVDMDYSTIRALGKPTDVHRGIFNGFSLPIYAADNEEVFLKVHIPHDWDEATDFITRVYGYIDTANDTKNFQLRLQWENVTPGTDTYPATDNDVDVETATGASAAQYQSYEVDFTIDYDIDGGGNELARGDVIGLLLQRMAASANEIAGEFVVTDVKMQYKRNLLGGT